MKRIVPFLAAFAVLATAPLQADEVEVSGLTFTKPEGWKNEKPSSQMRKAQFSVGEGDKAGEVVFFYFGQGGAGGVEANVKRWYGQFKGGAEKGKSEKAKAAGVPVTYVTTEGTYMSGPPRGPKVEKPDYALLGAIVESKEGAIFIKFTGPKATVEGATEAFKKMVGGAK